MAQSDVETVLTEDEATQGSKLGHIRYVLGMSLMLCVAAGLFFWLFY